MKKVITKDNQAVLIFSNSEAGSIIHACVYVNVRNGIELADATNIAKKFKSLASAEKWASKQLYL